ncbi:MAG: TIGR04283 family arsenosugar biosynthesis glycosyltransferase [Pseudomonadota bacterium]
MRFDTPPGNRADDDVANTNIVEAAVGQALARQGRSGSERRCPDPIISVVIPVFDDREALASLLAELAPWRARGVEVVVVEAGSAASAPPTMRAATDLWLHSSAGRGQQLGLGAEAARAERLWFLHADTRDIDAAADWLLARSTNTAGEVAWGRFDVAIRPRDWRLDVLAWFMIHRSRLTGIATGDQGIFVDRALLARVGGWPWQRLMEDIELSRRLRRIRPPLTPKTALGVSGRRWLRNGFLRTVLQMWWLRFTYFVGAHPDDIYRRYYGSDTRDASDSSPESALADHECAQPVTPASEKRE